MEQLQTNKKGKKEVTEKHEGIYLTNSQFLDDYLLSNFLEFILLNFPYVLFLFYCNY